MAELGPRLVLPEGVTADRHFGCDVLLDGYLAARDALEASLGIQKPATDAKLLAAAYRRWGPELQSRVHGEFAAVIFDQAAGVALLTHDALGTRHLFFTGARGHLCFATDLADMPPRVGGEAFDDDYIADFLVFGFISSARTPNVSIKRLEPGQGLRWKPGGVEPVRGWDLNALTPIRYKSDQDYEEHFRDLMRDAVSGSMASEGRTWISLSGGLDSAAIASVAASLGQSEIAAYSVFCARWPQTDERSWMKAVIDRYPMPWRAVDLWPILPFSVLPRWRHAEPTQAVVHEAQLRNRNALMAQEGAGVMLNGHAGDAVLCAAPGMVPDHLADGLFEGHPIRALRAVETWRRGASSARSPAFWALRGLIQPAIRHVRGRRLAGIDLDRPLSSWLRRDYAADMKLRDRVHQRVSPGRRTPGLQSLSDDLWLLSMATVTMSQRFLTFESRNPLLYLPLVEFMASIPWDQKLRPDRDRYLQRRALRDILPEAIRLRDDKASGTPLLVEGLRRSPEWLDYLSDDPLLAEHGIVDREAWRRVVKQASVGHTQNDKLFMAAVALEVWLRQARAPGEVDSGAQRQKGDLQLA